LSHEGCGSFMKGKRGPEEKVTFEEHSEPYKRKWGGVLFGVTQRGGENFTRDRVFNGVRVNQLRDSKGGPEGEWVDP